MAGWRRGWCVRAIGVLACLVAACGDNEEHEKFDKVTLQLKWVVQAQFAGYYAALDRGYYRDERLDVTILPGSADSTPEHVVADGGAEFGLDWLPSLLVERERGIDLVNIAQVFTRAGITEVTWKDSGITTIAQLRNKKVGVWCCGNQYQLFAALVKNGIDPNNAADVQIVYQPFDMNLFLSRQIDAAAAMTYNELAQVLETENPATGDLYHISDLNVIKLAEVGAGMLEDGIFVRGNWISDAKNQDVARRFLKATFKGWVFCRDHFSECLQIVLDHDPTLGTGHQRWQLNEVNALIWPAPLGGGVMDPAQFNNTVDISLEFGVIKSPPTAGAMRVDLTAAAVAALKDEGIDVNGANYQKPVVEETPGGK